MKYYEAALKIVKNLQDRGFTSYFAGGWVRDYLMGHPSDDIDIATSATVHEMQTIFSKTIPVGIQFGILIVVEDGHQFELATFRKDEGYEDGRRPIGISHATAEEDASRRDFTINGMFYDPIQKKLIDYVGGQKDLANKLVKAIGNPHERFLEDRLRMIRAARYACRFGFTIESHTKEAIILHADALFPSVAIERVWQEFQKIDRFDKFKPFLLKLHKLELLTTIFPDLENLSGETLEDQLSSLNHYPKKAPLIGKLLELFPNYSLADKLRLCDYLKLSNQDREFVEYYATLASSINNQSLELYDWAYLYAHPLATCSIEMFLSRLPAPERQHLLRHHLEQMDFLKFAITRIANKDPLVKSTHLQKEGIAPGKTMGALLKEAEKLSINLQLKDPYKVIELLKKTPLWPL